MGTVVQLNNKINNSYSELKSSVEDKLILVEERIKSRLAWGLVVDLHPTDYELRLGILQSKVEIQTKLHPGISAVSYTHLTLPTKA